MKTNNEITCYCETCHQAMPERDMIEPGLCESCYYSEDLKINKVDYAPQPARKAVQFSLFEVAQ